MNALDHLASVFLERLAWTSLQAAVLVAVVALLIRALPRLPAAARCALWWLVGAQALLGLCWQTPIRLPLLASAPTASMATPAIRQDSAPEFAPSYPRDATVPAMVVTPTPVATTPVDAASNGLAAHWRAALFSLWLALLLAQLPALMRQRQQARRLRHNAMPAARTDLQARCRQQARALGLRRPPVVMDSPDIDSPQVSGHWRPVVLWPCRAALGAHESTLALAHELAHVKRGDLALGWVPALAARLFFFHPLLRWAMREYALHREAACDALALAQQDVAPQDYGRLLLRLGVAHPLHAGLAGASPTFHNLKRRLAMLQENSRTIPRARSWLLVAIVAATGVLPYRVVATDHAAANPHTVAPASASSTWTPPAPPPPPPAPPMPPSALPPPPPAPPVPPPAPPRPHFGFHADNINVNISSNRKYGYALFDGHELTVRGTSADAAAIERLPKTGGPLLWMRRGNQTFVTHDAATIEQARQIMAPLAKLSRQQARLADQQGAVADQNAAIARRRAALAREQAAIARQQAMLTVQARQRALDAKQAELNQREAALDAQTNPRLHALAMRQTALDRQLAAHSSEIKAAADKTNAAMNKLIDEALAKGAAKQPSNT